MIGKKEAEVIALAFGGLAYLVALGTSVMKDGVFNANGNAEMIARNAERFARNELEKLNGS